MIILQLLEVYVLIGLVFMLVYILDVGRLISKKYGCGLMEGISRFERAGSTISNIQAVLYCILIWPRLYAAMRNGAWGVALEKMVDESDYVYDPNDDEER